MEHIDSVHEENKMIEEYKQLVVDEISNYRAKLDETEKMYKNLRNEIPPSITFTESQQKFLEECPDYVKYLKTIRKFHDVIILKEMNENREMNAFLCDGRNLIENTLKQIFDPQIRRNTPFP